MRFNYCCACGAWKLIIGFWRCRECYDAYFGRSH